MEYCGKYLGYRHLSGAKAVCGDDVGTHIVWCERCKKKNKFTAKTYSKDRGKKHGK